MPTAWPWRKQENKTLTVSSEDKGTVTMSDFSSCTLLASLELKPEITAPGGDIYSSLPFAQYGYMRRHFYGGTLYVRCVRRHEAISEQDCCRPLR